MTRLLLTAVMSAIALMLQAQVVEVSSINRVPVQGDFGVNIPRVSPDGSFAIVSSNSDAALRSVDLIGGTTCVVADNGSALELKFTPDGTGIVFKSATVGDNNRRFYSVESVDLSTGVQQQLTAAARHCSNFSVTDQGAVALQAEGSVRLKKLRNTGTTTSQRAIVGVHYGHLELTLPNGSTSYLDPQGRGSYLWPALSPDGTKICYYLAGSGCYVCNLDGSDVREIGFLHAPCWLGNDAVVGCQDYDDGVKLTRSSIVAATLSGVMQTLTPDSVIAINPSASADARSIVFATADGGLYVINLKQ